ncbi:hypothetical protein [Agrococcus sp. ProA11]|uniref:hypothetical protein n=1 Tax=Agrococcus chionoecetis TaxID=3153752 RepID=UPI00325FEAAF
MSRPRLHLRRPLPVAIVAAVTAMALTGCEPGALAPTDAATDSPSASATSEPIETPGATDEPIDAEPEPTVLPTTAPVAGELPCSDVYTADQLYDFNPNFAPSNQQGQLPGAIGEIAEAGGTVCVYEHVTGSDRLLIAVQQDASTSDYPGFETVGDEGIATTLANDALISVASVYFVSEQDARPVVDDVASNLD